MRFVELDRAKLMLYMHNVTVSRCKLPRRALQFLC